MKNIFLEPEIEVLGFLCDEILGADSYDTEQPGNPITPPTVE